DSNDYYLHLTYIQDKDAGSVFMEEGAATENPVIYEEYTWWAADIDNDVKKPAHIALNQNFPNPFNSSTNISFSLKDNGPVRLEIFDVTGSLVETLIDEYMPIGNYDINWNAEDCASGTYIYKLTSGGNTSVQKAVLIK
ncbi:MAG: T9SS type A sorting domain-containing protein, partial [candidate division Zixibacteria bacterium]|nr:T9SS type A sorting domain-containing protein [candidate division Zixibacteria bacterium]